MEYMLPFRTTFIKDYEAYGYPVCLPFSLSYDRRFHYIIQKKNKFVDNIMEKAYQTGVDPTVNAGEGEFGKSIEKGFDTVIDKLTKHHDVHSILDVGSGTGSFVKKLKDKGYDVEGVEPGKSLCNIAKQKYNINLHCGYLHEVKFRKKFDLLYAHGAIDHAPSQYDLVKQMVDVAEKDAYLFFNVPDQEFSLQTGDPSMMVHQHRAYFTEDTAVEFLEKIGLTDCGFWKSPFYAQYIYFWGRNREGIQKDYDISCESSLSLINTIQRYESNVARFLIALQTEIDNSMICKERMGLYGAISYPLGMLNWYGSMPRIFDKSQMKWDSYLPCNPQHKIEPTTSLKMNDVDKLFILAWRYNDEITEYLKKEIGFTGTIISIKELLEKHSKEG